MIVNFSHESDVTSLDPFLFYYCVPHKIRRGFFSKPNADLRHLLDSLVSALAVYATAFRSKLYLVCRILRRPFPRPFPLLLQVYLWKTFFADLSTKHFPFLLELDLCTAYFVEPSRAFFSSGDYSIALSDNFDTV